MNKEEERQFFANKDSEPHRVSMGGKRLSMSNFPPDMKRDMMNRLAEKDPVMQEALKGKLPGLKINGEEVSKDNISNFEIKPKEVKKEEPKKAEVKREEIKEKPKVEEKPKIEKVKKTKINKKKKGGK